jgi:hypothetical protein
MTETARALRWAQRRQEGAGPVGGVTGSADGGPLVPQPAATPEELRAALVALAPQYLAAFDDERTETVRASREQVSAEPLRRFCEQWAVRVAVERHPGTAARLRTLESRAAETEDLAEAREIVAEIGRILDMAFAEAGIKRAQAA